MTLGRGFRLLLCASTFVALACDPGIAPLVATTIEAATDDTVSGTVGSPLSQTNTPDVKVLDQEGNPIADVEVSWTVTAGGGNILGATSPTDEDGIASVGRWTLGTASGVNRLSASVAVVDGEAAIGPVVFVATGRAGPPVSVLITAGNNQSASTGLQVAVRPTVRLADQFDNPTPNINVLFQIFSGAGTVTVASQRTGQNGVASVGWTMGAAAGQNKLNASVADLGLVQFTATAILSACSVRTPYNFASTISGALENTDCVLANNKRVDFFEFVKPADMAIKFDQTAAAFAPYLYLYDAQGTLIAEDITVPDSAAVASSITLLAPATPTLVIGASSFQTQKLGAYSLTSSVVTGLVANCKPVFALRGIVTNQTVVATDCVDSAGPFYFDRFYIRLIAGVPVTIRMNVTSPSAINSFLELQFMNGNVAASADEETPATNNSTITNFVPATTGYFIIVASTQAANSTGAYILTIDPP